MLARDPLKPRSGRWAAAEKAIDDWGKTTRFCVILLVMLLCSIVWAVAAAVIWANEHAIAEAVIHALSR